MVQEMCQCHGCGAKFVRQEDLAYYSEAGIARYGVATAECSAVFFEILAIENERYGYPPAHRLVVDAYAVQHPRHPDYQIKMNISQRLIDASIQSIATHLIALYCALEKKIELSTIASIMDQVLSNLNNQKLLFPELSPPTHVGTITVVEMQAALIKSNISFEEYTKQAFLWAQSAWNAWAEHHNTVRQWYKEYTTSHSQTGS